MQTLSPIPSTDSLTTARSHRRLSVASSQGKESQGNLFQLVFFKDDRIQACMNVSSQKLQRFVERD
jgi:hypothetical protein